MKVKKTIEYKISPGKSGGENNMTLTFYEGEKDIGVSYSFHHWHDSIDHIIAELEKMAESLKEFRSKYVERK